jgi:D-xylose 1-dehydrogenase (NADP+, D-xylono-1,5-lactone-forming)
MTKTANGPLPDQNNTNRPIHPQELTMKKIIRWGILSTANIGRKAMIPALQASPLAEVMAVASRDSVRARQFADELGIPKVYGNYQAILDDPEIDAVYIPLPNHLHKPWSVKAAQAGKHILCEKPLALNHQECEEMIAAAEANNVILMESFMYRFHPRIKAAANWVTSGKLGKIKTIESAFTFPLRDKDDIRYQPEMGGGALMDVGCYCINLSRMMAGREPLRCHARATWSETGVDEQLVGLLDFGEGLIAHFDCGINQSLRQRAIIAGEEQFMVLRDVFLPGARKTSLHIVQNDQSQVHEFDGVDQYRLIAEDFMRAIANGKASSPRVDAVGNMRVIQALLESARQDGKSIPIK